MRLRNSRNARSRQRSANHIAMHSPPPPPRPRLESDVCQWLVVGAKEVRGFAGLAELVGADTIVMTDEDNRSPFLIARWISEDSCLCGVDLRATGRRAGYRNLPQRHRDDPMCVRWHATRREPVEEGRE